MTVIELKARLARMGDQEPIVVWADGSLFNVDTVTQVSDQDVYRVELALGAKFETL